MRAGNSIGKSFLNSSFLSTYLNAFRNNDFCIINMHTNVSTYNNYIICLLNALHMIKVWQHCFILSNRRVKKQN